MFHSFTTSVFFGMSSACGYLLGEALIPSVGSDTHVSIGTVCAVAAVVIPAAWTIARKFTRFEDRMERVEEKLSSLYCVRNKECEKDAK